MEPNKEEEPLEATGHMTHNNRRIIKGPPAGGAVVGPVHRCEGVD